ncbi:protein S40-4-like [Magnolia sinica]|uniref:protein S40-4-like n=1 Tax=Magnolia sinica TaxID=86752 RepID=UPI00265A381B|nr:protein S40-4-like [Magnolia sinica]
MIQVKTKPSKRRKEDLKRERERLSKSQTRISPPMAGKNHLSKPPYRFFNVDAENPVITDGPAFEFDESDLWNSHPLPSQTRLEHRKSKPSLGISKKPTRRNENGDRTAAAASSLPVSIPDWSKIVREDCGYSGMGEIDGDSDGEDFQIPPHEFLAKQYARRRISSFSVHEGLGRTLKGRDLSRVRNTIWEKTGFQD